MKKMREWRRERLRITVVIAFSTTRVYHQSPLLPNDGKYFTVNPPFSYFTKVGDFPNVSLGVKENALYYSFRAKKIINNYKIPTSGLVN